MISVIVPVYNAEPYLRACLDSVLDSAHRDFELILINDGSTDGSFQICQEYAGRDSRITLLSQENRGVSAARNLGLDHCGGEWVVFVDADDLISKSFFSLIAQEEHQQADMLLFDGTLKKAELDSIVPTEKKYFSEDGELLEFSRSILGPKNVYSVRPAWGKAYKRSIIERNMLRFDTALYYGEDMLFQLEYRLHVKSCIYIPQRVYFYHVHEDSSAHRFDPRLLNNHVMLLEKVRRVLDAHQMLPLLEKDYYSYVLDEISMVLIQLAFDPRNGMPYREECRLCAQIRQYEFCRQAAKYNLKYGTVRRRILLACFYLKWYRAVEAICKVVHIRRKRRESR